MTWRALLQQSDESLVCPWIGGRALRFEERAYGIEGALPEERGWHCFSVRGRKVTWTGVADALSGALRHVVRGYLIGDRLVRDDARAEDDALKIIAAAERVHLVPPGLDRFARIAAGRPHEGGPLVFEGQEMPLGPEDDVQRAFVDLASLETIRNVMPALHAAFRMEVWRRDEAARYREQLALARAREAARIAEEERLDALYQRAGDAAGRRALLREGRVDFETAARAALAVSGATYLDHRVSVRRGEMVVQFRFLRMRFECTCDERTLRIVDSGICLTDHTTGERGDTYFTLESLPAVIQQADHEDRLVVFRHVGD